MSKILYDALVEIANLGDTEANEYLTRTGRYARFDEPGSVRTAREAIEAYSGTAGMPLPLSDLDAGAKAIFDGPPGGEAPDRKWEDLTSDEQDQFRTAARLAVTAIFTRQGAR